MFEITHGLFFSVSSRNCSRSAYIYFLRLDASDPLLSVSLSLFLYFTYESLNDWNLFWTRSSAKILNTDDIEMWYCYAITIINQLKQTSWIYYHYTHENNSNKVLININILKIGLWLYIIIIIIIIIYISWQILNYIYNNYIQTTTTIISKQQQASAPINYYYYYVRAKRHTYIYSNNKTSCVHWQFKWVYEPASY